jgi:carbonic anhydrase
MKTVDVTYRHEARDTPVRCRPPHSDATLLRGRAPAPEQYPFAALLGCSDARVPVELIFSEGPNDLFAIRVAGNGLGAEVLGSLKYAVGRLGRSLKPIVVLGHSSCGR